MTVTGFITRQIWQVRQHGPAVLLPKVKRLLVEWPVFLVLSIVAIPVVVAVRLMRPWLLVRFFALRSHHLGHFAADTELYLCERDAGINAPARRHVDLAFMGSHPIANVQLARMWRRVLRIWPAWILGPIAALNRRIPGGAIHETGENANSDRDVHNLLDRYPPHLRFTPEEEARGQAGLQNMGISPGTPYVCLIVRDNAYTASRRPLADHSFHDYRDCDIQHFGAAALELANRGYVVLRMGARVREAFRTAHPRILDYATNGMRSDFMDVYLGATCAFCVSSGTGFDSIPTIFRRPVAFVNLVPADWISTSGAQFLSTIKRHCAVQDGRELTLSEILALGAGTVLDSREYAARGVRLVENTPEEIRDVVIEMVERLRDAWQSQADDEELQRRFWELFPVNAVREADKRPLHGEVRSRYGAAFLRNNREWLR